MRPSRRPTTSTMSSRSSCAPSADPVSTTSRDRIIAATYACVTRLGMAKTTMEDIAREADLSRATIYRAFPGGRAEALAAVVPSEVARFFDRVSAAIHAGDPHPVTLPAQGPLPAQPRPPPHDPPPPRTRP